MNDPKDLFSGIDRTPRSLYPNLMTIDGQPVTADELADRWRSAWEDDPRPVILDPDPEYQTVVAPALDPGRYGDAWLAAQHIHGRRYKGRHRR